jgi:hypothetical protein
MLNYLDPGQVQIARTPGATGLRIEIVGDRTILNGKIKRIFPLTHPDKFLSIQEEGDKEVGVLRALDGMDEQSTKLVHEELDRRYFTPTILRIDDLKQDAGMWRFTVETQRGPSQFYVRNWRDNSHEVQPGRWQIHTVDGQRFDIPNLEALDARSKNLLIQLI